MIAPGIARNQLTNGETGYFAWVIRTCWLAVTQVDGLTCALVDTAKQTLELTADEHYKHLQVLLVVLWAAGLLRG